MVPILKMNFSQGVTQEKSIMIITISLFPPSDNYYKWNQLTLDQLLNHLHPLKNKKQKQNLIKELSEKTQPRGILEDGVL